MNLPTKTTAQATMSSLEIAKLVESRHDSVKLSIERLAKSGVIQLPPMVETPNSQGVMVKNYLIEKRDSYVVVAQLSPAFTGKLVDRWQELESQQKPMNMLEWIAYSALQLNETNKRLAEAEERLHQTETDICELKADQSALSIMLDMNLSNKEEDRHDHCWAASHIIKKLTKTAQS